MRYFNCSTRIGSTVLAALRMWQAAGDAERAPYNEIASAVGAHRPLPAYMLDSLCEEMNCGGGVVLSETSPVSPNDAEGAGRIPYTPAPDEGPAGIVVDALAMLSCVDRAECFDGAAGGYFVLQDGREFRFSVEEPLPAKRFRNRYACDQCGNVWQDEWECTCNDKCGECGAEIEPKESEEIEA